MRLTLPPLFRIQEKQGAQKKNIIQQLLLPSVEVEVDGTLFTRENFRGYRLTSQSNPDLLIFNKKPTGMVVEDNETVLVAPKFSLDDEEQVLEDAKWWSHPQLTGTVPSGSIPAQAAFESWHNGFQFIEEDASRGIIGLRQPQLGALHAVHARWSMEDGIATIVMPTGTGKTETMLSTLISVPCKKVLVVVPTDALRTQIAEKFISLGILKLPHCQLTSPDVEFPVVGMLKTKPTSMEEVEEMFNRCNVVISTSAIVGQSPAEIQTRISDICTELFIDEAHHSEARTWKEFKQHFSKCRVLQFTATPFREDGRLIDGKIIYSYPLRRAQAEGYFRPIQFVSVMEFDPKRADEQIALRAVQELENDQTGKHVVMARVARIERAKEVLQIYARIGKFNPVLMHTGLSTAKRAESRQKLLDGTSRIVICVDMLGEGFDMPELKIAAFHDIRKTLSVTLQLAGRFTRSREDLGNATFIANVADISVQEELYRLYTQDPDWNSLLPALSESVIQEQHEAQEFISGFGEFPPEIPLHSLRPAASTVIYRAGCANWTPRKFKDGLKGGRNEQIYYALNEHESTLVIVTSNEQPVAWSNLDSIRDWILELYIAVWDRDKKLLFVHGSSNSGEFKDLAKALCGSDVTLVVDPDVFRCFHGINRLMLTNVGLNEHFGRQIRYTGRMGADVGSRLARTSKQSARKAVLAGFGYENGQQVSMGAGKRGRVWSHLRLRVDTFAKWCRSLGSKVNDNSIDPEKVLEGTLRPELVGEIPTEECVCIDWPSEVYEDYESGTKFKWDHKSAYVTEVSIDLVEKVSPNEVHFRVWGDSLMDICFRLRLITLEDDRKDYKIEYVSDEKLEIIHRGSRDACDFFEKFPPVIWFADGSTLEGCTHIALQHDQPPFDAGKLITWNWDNVDLSKESQGLSRQSDSVQYKTIQMLRSNAVPYCLIFDDDGSGEAADVVCARLVEENNETIIEVEFYHCKYAIAGAPAARIDDLYVLCGQAQKSIGWLHNKHRKQDLFTHLLRRDDKRVNGGNPTRFEIGDKDTLISLRDLSRMNQVRIKVFVVQPGLSKAMASADQLTLLGVTENFLLETYEVPFSVICSE